MMIIKLLHNLVEGLKDVDVAVALVLLGVEVDAFPDGTDLVESLGEVGLTCSDTTLLGHDLLPRPHIPLSEGL